MKARQRRKVVPKSDERVDGRVERGWDDEE